MNPINWAFAQDGLTSAQKFVLVALADYASESLLLWPSVAAIVEKTGMDRKTILESLATLEKRGLIRDTGGRKGHTKSVKVFSLEITSDTGNGTTEQYQNRDSMDVSSTVFPTKQSRFSHQAVPKTGQGTTQRTTQGTTQRNAARVSPEDSARIIAEILAERPDLASLLKSEYERAERRKRDEGDPIRYADMFRLTILEGLTKQIPAPTPGQKPRHVVRLRTSEIDAWLEDQDRADAAARETVRGEAHDCLLLPTPKAKTEPIPPTPLPGDELEVTA